jgi:hypothetical protein
LPDDPFALSFVPGKIYVVEPKVALNPEAEPAFFSFETGVAFRDGRQPVEIAERFKEAAELGHLQAAGAVPSRRMRVKVDLPRALRFAPLAAIGDDPVGLAVLARMLRPEEGTPKDQRQASELTRRLAEAGSPFGLAEWGFCLANAIGVDRGEATGAWPGGRPKSSASGA